MRILNAREVAQYLLLNQHSAEVADRITNLKLQKLCYYAQGLALVKLQRPLFSEDIEHWQHGPVVPTLWREYWRFGRNPIPIPDKALGAVSVDDDVKGLLDQVLNDYGFMSAWELRNKTHNEPPWNNTPDECAITHQKMRTYFQTVVDSMATDVDKFRDSQDGDSLRDRMAGDTKFRELTEIGLAELASEEYYTWEEVRKSLADL